MTVIKYEKKKPGSVDAEDSASLHHVKLNEPDPVERGSWSGKMEFLLSCLGYAVGLGNVWRFPYLCFKNGGGSFLIPYFLMLVVIGIPAFLMELHIGQYSAMGPTTVYSSISPLFKGLGFANIFAQCFIGVYYNIIIAWTIYYLCASFTADLPWQHCTNQYNDQYCFSFSEFKECEALRNNRSLSGLANNIIYLNRSCIEDPVVLKSVSDNVKSWYGSEMTVYEGIHFYKRALSCKVWQRTHLWRQTATT